MDASIDIVRHDPNKVRKPALRFGIPSQLMFQGR